MRLAWYAGASTALAAGVFATAFHQRANFYSAMVHLAQSSLSLMILVNLAFLMYGSFVYGLQRLCFGQLRPVEIEQLYEKAWFAVTETCLAMTIFREEVGAFFLVMFTLLVTGKIWGWISEGRVEVLEQQPPANPRLFHARLIISLLFSIIYDLWLLNYIVGTVVQQARPTMMVMFLFEFAVLTIGSFHTAGRYSISLWEARTVKKQTERRLEDRRREVREQRAEILRRRETEGATETEGEAAEPIPSEDDIDEMDIEVPGWEAKGLWVLGLDLIADLIKLIIYSAFFCVLFTFYGLPIHIMRDLFLTTRSFVKRLGALLRYQQALKDMNKYPDATAEELGREDTCIICREEMQPWDAANPGQVERSRPKKLPCGHILHFGCLKSWLERQQVCPTCRRSVVMDPPAQARNRNPLLFRLGLNDNQGRQPPANGAVPAGAPGGPLPQGGGQNGQNGGQNGRNGGFRLNLGPIRLVVAQGHAEDLEDVVRRLENPHDDANRLAAAPTQQAGGLGQNTNSSALLADIQAQLADVNQRVINATERVQQDVQGLRDAETQLLNLTLLLQEMTRLNQLRIPVQTQQQIGLEQQLPQQQPQQPPAQPNGTTAPDGVRGHPHVQGLPIPPTVPRIPGDNPPLTFPIRPELNAQFAQYTAYPSQPLAPFGPRINAATVTRHGGASLSTAIPSGSPDLPDGVVIPQGWSLLPLQRLDPRGGPQFTGPSPGLPSIPRGAERSQSATRPPTSEMYGEFILPGGFDNAGARAAVWGQPRANSAPATDPSSTAAETSAASATTEVPTAESSQQDEARGREKSAPALAEGEEDKEVTASAPAPAPTSLPNWGGSAQLFNGHSREDHQETPRETEPSHAEDQAGSSLTTDSSTTTEKGKGKAVMVEDESEDDT